MRLLLDTNVLLDVLLQRGGYVGSKRILDLCETGSHQAIVSWHTFPTVYFYYRKVHTEQDTWDMLRELLRFIDVPTTGKADMLNAWSYSMSDFEDALQAASAMAENADAILTRNTGDFLTSPVKAYTPEDFMAKFSATS